MNSSLESKRKRSRKKIRWIPVVTAFLRKGDEILIGQRPENHSLAGKWEFPGGKIENGEIPEEALTRELREELGIEATIGEIKLSYNQSYGELNILILFFEVLYWKGEPKARHHMKLEWIKPELLLQRSIPDANLKIMDRIFKALGVPWPK